MMHRNILVCADFALSPGLMPNPRLLNIWFVRVLRLFCKKIPF